MTPSKNPVVVFAGTQTAAGTPPIKGFSDDFKREADARAAILANFMLHDQICVSPVDHYRTPRFTVAALAVNEADDDGPVTLPAL